MGFISLYMELPITSYQNLPYSRKYKRGIRLIDSPYNECKVKKKMMAKELSEALKKQIAENEIKREEERKKKLKEDIEEEERIKRQLKILERKLIERKSSKPKDPKVKDKLTLNAEVPPIIKVKAEQVKEVPVVAVKDIQVTPVKEINLVPIKNQAIPKVKEEVKLPNVIVNIDNSKAKYDNELNKLKKEFAKQDEEFKNALKKFKDSSSKITDAQVLAERELVMLRSYINKGLNEMYDTSNTKNSLFKLNTRDKPQYTKSSSNYYDSNIKNILNKKIHTYNRQYKEKMIIKPVNELKPLVIAEKQKTQCKKLDDIIEELLSDIRENPS